MRRWQPGWTNPPSNVRNLHEPPALLHRAALNRTTGCATAQVIRSDLTQIVNLAR